MEQLSDVVTDDPDEEGDEDDGQDDPHPNAGVQQELWTGHRSLFNQPTETLTGETLGDDEGLKIIQFIKLFKYTVCND